MLELASSPLRGGLSEASLLALRPSSGNRGEQQPFHQVSLEETVHCQLQPLGDGTWL